MKKFDNLTLQSTIHQECEARATEAFLHTLLFLHLSSRSAMPSDKYLGIPIAIGMAGS